MAPTGSKTIMFLYQHLRVWRVDLIIAASGLFETEGQKNTRLPIVLKTFGSRA